MCIQIVHELRKARGSNKKLAILKKYKNNKYWLKTLQAMYDSSINYYTSAPDDLTFLDGTFLDYPEIFEVLEVLSSRKFTGKVAQAFAVECSQRFGEIYRLILGRSLKAGVSIITVNKAYPGLIKTFDVMLAKDVDLLKYPILASIKYDGVRVLAFVGVTGITSLKTREGKTLRIESLEKLLSGFAPGVYDGELVAGNGKQAGRTKITGQVNKCLLGTATDIEDSTFCIFDHLTHIEWREQKTERTYSHRLYFLKGEVKEEPGILLAKQYMLSKQEDVNRMYAFYLKLGYEGLILRYPDDAYIWKRSAKLIKKKATKECKLMCVGATKGTGKYEGLIGALICEGRVECKQVNVKLGTGLTDQDRELSVDDYKGYMIDVLYNDLVKAKKALVYSLFLPRFKRVSHKLDT